jgi:hypothetical protein
MPINFLCGPWAFWECAQNMAKGLRAESNDGIRTFGVQAGEKLCPLVQG